MLKHSNKVLKNVNNSIDWHSFKQECPKNNGMSGTTAL